MGTVVGTDSTRATARVVVPSQRPTVPVTSSTRPRSFFPAAPPALNAFDTFQTGASYWIAVTEAVVWAGPVDGASGVP